jgi:hypothetical protein
MTGGESPQILVDKAWWPLGDGTDPAEGVADALIDTFAAELATPARSALRANLVAYAEWSQSLTPGERRSFALVRDQRLGQVDALLSWRYSALADDIYAEYLSLARNQRSTPRVELVNPVIEERRLAGGRAIVIHDFVVFRDGGVQQAARERVTVAYFLDAAPALIELHIATPDLTLFDDIVEHAVGMVSGEVVGVPGYLERAE